MKRQRTVQHRWLHVDGHQVHCLQAGEGADVLVVASMLIRAQTYGKTVQALAGKFRVTVVDLPGAGPSSPVERPWTFDAYATLLGRTVELLGMEDAIVVGHSNSGPVVLLHAQQRPSQRIVLVDSIGGRFQRKLGRIIGARGLDALFEMRLNGYGLWHALGNLLRHRRNFWNQVKLAAAFDLLEIAFAMKSEVRALVAWGARDHAMPPSSGVRLARALNAPIAWARGCHDWLITSPQQLLPHLEKLSARPA